MWTIEQVKDELNRLCAADGLPELTIPVRANARLTRTLGRVRYMGDTCLPLDIEFAQRLLDNGTFYDVTNVIKHEYVHYYLLCTTGVNHGHDALFKRKCAEIGCEFNTTQGALEYEKNEGPAQYKYEVWCDGCESLVATYSRMCKTLKNLQYCKCGNCGSKELRLIQNW